MSVVDGDHHRAGVGEVDDQPVQTVHQREAQIVARRGLERRWARLARIEQRPGEPRRAVEQCVVLDRIGAVQHPLQELPGHSVRELLLELPGSGAEYQHPLLLGHFPRRRQQCGLADPRRSFDHHKLPRARDGATDQVMQRSKLGLTIEQARDSS